MLQRRINPYKSGAGEPACTFGVAGKHCVLMGQRCRAAIYGRRDPCRKKDGGAQVPALQEESPSGTGVSPVAVRNHGRDARATNLRSRHQVISGAGLVSRSAGSRLGRLAGSRHLLRF